MFALLTLPAPPIHTHITFSGPILLVLEAHSGPGECQHFWVRVCEGTRPHPE